MEVEWVFVESASRATVHAVILAESKQQSGSRHISISENPSISSHSHLSTPVRRASDRRPRLTTVHSRVRGGKGVALLCGVGTLFGIGCTRPLYWIRPSSLQSLVALPCSGSSGTLWRCCRSFSLRLGFAHLRHCLIVVLLLIKIVESRSGHVEARESARETRGGPSFGCNEARY